MSHDTRRRVVFFFVCLVVVAMVLSVTACSALTEADDGTAVLSADEYPTVMAGICSATSTELDALPEPPTQISRVDWVGEVARILENEAGRFAELRVTDDVRETHGSLERTAREQAMQLTLLGDALGAAGQDNGVIETVSDEIRSLSIGRDELATELGVPGCGARALT
ncbi:MAG: hypothetical protein AB8G26_07640 [Ilumatobacter sp.]